MRNTEYPCQAVSWRQYPVERHWRRVSPSAMSAAGDAAPDALWMLLVRNQIAPAQKIVDGERAGTSHRGVEIVWSRGDDGRGQFWWRIVQQRLLGEPQVGQPDGAEPSR